MPIIQYFGFVGAALLALILVTDFCLPKATFASNAGLENALMQMASDRRTPPLFTRPDAETQEASAGQ